jgi:hypothetical protein
MALKPMEMRSRRDAMVVVMLGYFLLLTHYFYSQSIPTGLWLLASVHAADRDPDPAAWRRPADSGIARYAGLLLLQALPFMLIALSALPARLRARSGACRRTPTPA